MDKRRCRPGDLALVVYSTNPALIGRTVLVERWGQYDRWDVTLIGPPSFGLAFETRRPVIGNKTAARDSSLVPLRGNEPDTIQQVGEVNYEQ